MQGHGALRGVQHKQFTPTESEQCNLVGHLEIGEEGNVPGPLHGREQQTCCQLTDVLDAHEIVWLHALLPVPGGRVRFCTKKH